jgi:outer membrane protein TolC
VDWQACLRLAEQRHPALVAARAELAAAEAAVGVAGSARLPQLGLGAAAQRSDSDRLPEGGDTSLSAALNVEQTLYSGGANAARIEASRTVLQRTEALTVRTLSDLSHSLRTAYANLLFAQQQVTLLTGIEQRRHNNLELVELRYEGGREHKGSLALSRAADQEATVDLREARREEALRRETLRRTIGLVDASVSLVATGKLDVLEAPSPLDVAELVRRTPEYARARAEKLAAEIDLRSARSGYRPTLALSGSAGRYGDEDAFDDDRWSVGLRLSFPFWPGGRTRYEVARARALLRKAEADLADNINDIAVSLAETLRAYESAVATVDIQAVYVRAAEVRAEIARREYEDGLLPFENWDLIENDLISRKRRLLEARRAAVVAESAWRRAAGYSAFAVPGTPDSATPAKERLP